MRHFLLNSKNIERDSYIWNMASAILVAFQSVILLIILTRAVDLAIAGIFTIANANANLFLTIGKFGARNYQISDVKYEYSLLTYKSLRYYTTLLMLVISVVYLIYSAHINAYPLEKSMIILWMCIYKLPESIEDVYYGEYQRNGRLDVAGKAMTTRLVVTMVFFSAAVISTKNLLISTISSTIFTFILMYYLLHISAAILDDKPLKKSRNSLKNLIFSCFPVFASAFLSFYIGNAPKYAIDSLLSDELQAIYGFLSMPVFVVGLLNSFIFNPILFPLSCQWAEGKVAAFTKRIIRQTLIVIAITIICIIGAYIIGIPVLSWLYNTELTDYKKDLLLLLVGGGFLGASGVYTAILTIMRMQIPMMIGYIFVGGIALLLSDPIVSYGGISGAVLLYNVLMLGLCIIFIGMIWYGIRHYPSSSISESIRR